MKMRETVETLLDAGQLDALNQTLRGTHPADIADLLEQLPNEKAVILFEMLPNFEASEVLDEANSSLTAELVEKVDDERLADLLDTLPMDDAAELLEDLPDETSERLIGLMEPDEAHQVRQILSYPEDSAGRLMTQDVAAFRSNWTAKQAVEYLRAIDDTETVHYLYVVDVVGRLIGVVPIRNLLLAKGHETVDTLMLDEIHSIPATADKEKIAKEITRYDLTAVPVIDDENHLIGVVTVDDAVDIITEEITEDIQQLGGSSPLEQPYFSVSAWTMMRKRVGWLVLLFVASFLSSFVLRSFESLTKQVIILAAFIPLITGTGGNAGSQTVATIIRALAVGEVRWGDMGRAIRRELLVGLMMGIALGAAGLLYATILQAGLEVGLVIAFTLPIVVVWSTLVATIIPMTAERLKVDPTVVSAPMITTIVDATGLLIYFGLATLLL